MGLGAFNAVGLTDLGGLLGAFDAVKLARLGAVGEVELA